MEKYVFELFGHRFSLFSTIFCEDSEIVLKKSEMRGENLVLIKFSMSADFNIECYLPSGKECREPQLPISVALFYFYRIRGLPFGSVELEYFGKTVNTDEYELGQGFCRLPCDIGCGYRWERAEFSCGVSLLSFEYFSTVSVRGIFVERLESFDTDVLALLKLPRGRSAAAETFAISVSEPYRIITQKDSSNVFSVLSAAVKMASDISGEHRFTLRSVCGARCVAYCKQEVPRVELCISFLGKE